MSKDPAILWYFDNWAGGTVTMSRFLKGCYMDILNAQFNNGHLSLDEIKTVLGSDFGQTWPTLQKKFDRDQSGLFFSKRMDEEIEKRKNYVAGEKKFSDQQRDRVQKRYQKSTGVLPQEGNGIGNEIGVGVVLEKSEKPFESFQNWWKLYDKEVNKFSCERLWAKMTEDQRQKALSHTPKYVDSTPDKSYRKNPETYLQNESWNDEIIVKAPIGKQEQKIVYQAPKPRYNYDEEAELTRERHRILKEKAANEGPASGGMGNLIRKEIDKKLGNGLAGAK